MNDSILKLEGVDDVKGASFYCGKKVAYVYRAKREIRGSKIRVIWGKISRTHGTILHPSAVDYRIPTTLVTDYSPFFSLFTGNSGAVRARFRNNLPPKTFGATVRVMLYPSSI